MLDRTSAVSSLVMAGVQPLPKELVAAYQDDELLRQRPWMWRTFNHIHPSLPLWMTLVGAITVAAGVVLVLCFGLSALTTTDAGLGIEVLTNAAVAVASVLLVCAGIGLIEQYNVGHKLRWTFVSVGTYEAVRGRMPARAYEMIDAIRAVTDMGEFRLKVVGKDPILNYAADRQEFDPPAENYDLLIWGKDKEIVLLT